LRRRFAAAFLAAAAVAGFLAWKGDKVVDKVLDLRYGQMPTKPAYTRPRDAAEAHRQDLDYLARLTEYDRSFSDDARREFQRRIAALREKAASLTPAEFLMGVAEAVALADNPHTNIERSDWRALLNSLPVRFEWFADGLHVVRATRANAELLGARVIAIDGVDPEALARESTRYFRGPAEHSRVGSLLVLESPQALHVLHPQAPEDRIALRVADAEGREKTLQLAAVDPKDAPATLRPGWLLSPQASAGERPGEWLGLPDASQELPPSLREPGRVFYSARLAPDILYMHLWQIHDAPGAPLDGQIRAALGPADAAPWKRIILDLRFDTGGDYPAVYGALRDLPKRLAPDGKLVIVVDHTTFSAAIIAAALAKHFAGARAVIVGERPRDRLTFWAEGATMQLPHSKIEIPLATGYHDWAHGCREWRCFWPNVFRDVAAGSVEPDVAVGWRFADYRRGIDTVLEKARE
jgi:hypothetical protein